MKLSARNLPWALALWSAALATPPGAHAALPAQHGQFFDGCPLCTSGKMGADGTPLDSVALKDVAGEALTKPKPLPELKQRPDGFWDVSFTHLASFPFEAPAADTPQTPATSAKIPENIRALHGKRIRIGGYMLPTKLENGLVKEFLLLRSSLLCCYGIVPSPTEWVIVKMSGKGVAPAMDVPMNFYGTLQVGEIYEGNTFVGLYAMSGDKVSVE